MKCYRIKDCCFNGTEPKVSKCEPHRTQVGCWEYDWLAYFLAMPECDAKYEWRDVMLDECPNCPVYSLHHHEVERFLSGLKKAETKALGIDS